MIISHLREIGERNLLVRPGRLLKPCRRGMGGCVKKKREEKKKNGSGF